MGFFNFLKRGKQPTPDSELDMPPLPPAIEGLKDEKDLPATPPLNLKPPVFSGLPDLNEDFPPFPELESDKDLEAKQSVQFNPPLFPRVFQKNERIPSNLIPMEIAPTPQDFPAQPDLTIEMPLPEEEPVQHIVSDKSQIEQPYKKSIYLSINNFNDSLAGISNARKNARKLKELSNDISDANTKNEANFENYRKSLVSVQDKLKILDKKIFG